MRSPSQLSEVIYTCTYKATRLVACPQIGLLRYIMDNGVNSDSMDYTGYQNEKYVINQQNNLGAHSR